MVARVCGVSLCQSVIICSLCHLTFGFLATHHFSQPDIPKPNIFSTDSPSYYSLFIVSQLHVFASPRRHNIKVSASPSITIIRRCARTNTPWKHDCVIPEVAKSCCLCNLSSGHVKFIISCRQRIQQHISHLVISYPPKFGNAVSCSFARLPGQIVREKILL